MTTNLWEGCRFPGAVGSLDHSFRPHVTGAEIKVRRRCEEAAKSEEIHLRREGVVGKKRIGGEAEGRKPAQPSIPEGILGFPSL
jgi:hypothetical protein